MKFPSPSDYRFLLAGFDTVQAAYYLSPTSGAEFSFEVLHLERERLKAAKVREGAPVELGGWSLQLKPHGSGSGYPFVLRHPDYTFECGEFNNPSFFVTFRSEALWRVGLKELHERFLTWAEAVGLRLVRPETVSRVDFAFDYVLEAPAFTEQHVVSLSAKDSKYREDGRTQTLAFGKGDVMLRIYDKVTEIAQQSDKVWLFQLWGVSENVWRVEWQVRKAVLRRFGLRTFEDLFGGYGDALRYLATEHDTLRIPTKDSNRSRWPLDPLWIDLADRIATFPAEGTYREVDEQMVLQARQQRVAIIVYGYLKHYAALIGTPSNRDIGLSESQSTLLARIDRLHDPLSWQLDVLAKRERIRLGK